MRKSCGMTDELPGTDETHLHWCIMEMRFKRHRKQAPSASRERDGRQLTGVTQLRRTVHG